MPNASEKLFDQIFDLKFTSKQLVKESKRCEAEENSQKKKAAQAMQKSEFCCKKGRGTNIPAHCWFLF